MELIFGIYYLALPLVGWWLFLSRWQSSVSQLESLGFQSEGFVVPFLQSVGLAFAHATPECHMRSIHDSSLSLRWELLALSLRSLSYLFLVVVFFSVWVFVPEPVLLLLGLTLFLLSRWWVRLEALALGVLGLGLFVHGWSELMGHFSRWFSSGETPLWVYGLATNFLPGALIGVCLGAGLRGLFRISGVALWSGASLLAAGVLSLGGAWGLFLGDFIAGVLEDGIRYSGKAARLRLLGALVFAVLGLLATAPFLHLVMDFFGGAYSTQLRMVQLCIMVIAFLGFETLASMTFFHFYFEKKKAV